MATLYHYTTASTLLGILSKCSAENPYITIWATHASYLNDPTEYKYGKMVCLDTIKEIENELNISESKRFSNIYYSNEINHSIELLDFIASTNPSTQGGIPYIVSLSKNKDSLPMWNTYTQKGNSISIGFDEDLLCKGCWDWGEKEERILSAMPMLEEKYEVRECIYDTSHKDFISIRENFKKEYLELLNATNSTNEEIKADIKQVKAIALLERFYKALAPYIKDKAYEYEQEVRFLVKDKGKIHFRESNGLIVPYVKKKIPCDCIKEIIIGPTMDAKRTKDSLTMLFINKGIKAILSEEFIKISTAPYR